jgi:hypothetical protein
LATGHWLSARKVRRLPPQLTINNQQLTNWQSLRRVARQTIGHWSLKEAPDLQFQIFNSRCPMAGHGTKRVAGSVVELKNGN